MTVQESWTRIETWLGTNAPDVLAALNPGASDKSIAEAEEAIGVTFPDDVKASYAMHDGQEPDGLTLMPNGEFLSLERMREEWDIWKELLDAGDFEGNESSPAKGVKNDWWNPAWIPITSDGAGNHDCLDLDPAKGGNVGQVITMYHDEDTREIEAPSFAEWLEVLANGLENGDYVLSKELGWIVRKGEE